MTRFSYLLGAWHASDPRAGSMQLLDSATRVFIARGYRRTQMADVAREMGVSAGALYGYVESKEALFHLLIDRAFTGAPAEPPGAAGADAGPRRDAGAAARAPGARDRAAASRRRERARARRPIPAQRARRGAGRALRPDRAHARRDGAHRALGARHAEPRDPVLRRGAARPDRALDALPREADPRRPAAPRARPGRRSRAWSSRRSPGSRATVCAIPTRRRSTTRPRAPRRWTSCSPGSSPPATRGAQQ